MILELFELGYSNTRMVIDPIATLQCDQVRTGATDDADQG